MKVKSDASIDDCSAQILLAAIEIESLFAARGIPLVITSGSEPYKHSASRSAHYRGDAIDVRSRQVTDKRQLLRSLKRKLGPNFVILLESPGQAREHYHIHWSPVNE